MEKCSEQEIKTRKRLHEVCNRFYLCKRFLQMNILVKLTRLLDKMGNILVKSKEILVKLHLILEKGEMKI